MIKNGRQYEHSKKKLHELEEDLKAIRKKYYLDKNKVALLSQGYIEHIVQFKDEIKEYEDMIKAPFPEVLLIHNLNKISRSIVRLRIARKITQEELAQRVGCKQSDISRLERDDYYGYTIGQLDKIMAGLGVKIELNLFPKESAITEQERRERKELKKDSELANAAYTKWITRKVEIFQGLSTEGNDEILLSNNKEEDIFNEDDKNLKDLRVTFA
jgi:transcriptional regulator with XRE-family HTH domain